MIQQQLGVAGPVVAKRVLEGDHWLVRVHLTDGISLALG